MKSRAVFFAIGVLFAFVIGSCGNNGDSLSISDPYINAIPGGTAALYFTVANDSEADTLTRVTVDHSGLTATFHENVVDGNSVRMEPRDAIDIPAEGQFSFRSGEYHVMLEGSVGSLKEGDRIEFTAWFANAGEKRFSAEVHALGAGHAGGH